jgi:ACS family sodium-dependent inorganic phosphate cotransporter
VPWGRILRNPAVLALCASHTCHNSQLYMLLSWMPTYLREQVGLDLASAGAAAVLPFLACFAASAVAGVAGDAALKRGASASLVRKTAMTVSEVLPALAMLALGRTTNPGAAVAALTVALGLSGACSAGFAANGLDIAPRYAGVVFGLSNTLATLPGILSPALVGALVAAPHNDRAHWNVAFTLSAAVSFVGWGVFLVFGRGNRQRELDGYDDAGSPPASPGLPGGGSEKAVGGDGGGKLAGGDELELGGGGAGGGGGGGSGGGGAGAVPTRRREDESARETAQLLAAAAGAVSKV